MLRLFLTAGLLVFVGAETRSATLAEALDGMSRISFGLDSNLTIGDTIDVADPGVPKNRCQTYEAASVKLDTAGAVSSVLSFRFVRDFDQFENTFKLSYRTTASSSVNFGKVLGGGSTLTAFGSFENFLKRDSETVLILIDASADHGRELIQDFKLDKKYQDLLDAGKFADFRDKCGTHFIRGYTKKSAISVIIEVSHLSKEAKIVLQNTMSAAANATIGVKEFTGTAKTSTTTTLSDTLKLASKLGKVSARVEAMGGQGIGTIAGMLGAGDLTNPENIDKLLTKLAESAKDFTLANAAPHSFAVISHPGLNAANIVFNPDNFEKLGSIYRVLVRVDQRLALYNEYRMRDAQLWNAYFRIKTEEIQALRKSLVEAYRACKSDGRCDAGLPTQIDGLILDDLFADGKLEARCIYSYQYSDVINGKEVDKFNYLSSIAVVWSSKIHFLKNIDQLSSEVKVITSDFELVHPQFDPQRRQSIRTSESGMDGEIFVDLFRQAVDRNKVIVNGEIKVDAIRNLRKQTAQSLYVMSFRTYNGFEIETVMGRPDMQSCPAYVQN